MDKSKKGHSKLIIACSDPAENFEFIEETLNQVAFLIGARREGWPTSECEMAASR